jgi:hypothetical protein
MDFLGRLNQEKSGLGLSSAGAGRVEFIWKLTLFDKYGF